MFALILSGVLEKSPPTIDGRDIADFSGRVAGGWAYL
jgi:hypothetical protein